MTHLRREQLRTIAATIQAVEYMREKLVNDLDALIDLELFEHDATADPYERTIMRACMYAMEDARAELNIVNFDNAQHLLKKFI